MPSEWGKRVSRSDSEDLALSGRRDAVSGIRSSPCFAPLDDQPGREAMAETLTRQRAPEEEIVAWIRELNDKAVKLTDNSPQVFEVRAPYLGPSDGFD